MADQTFTSGQILTASQMSTLQANSGLIPMTPTSSTGGTIAANKISFSAQSSVLINGCFTSAYTNYRLVGRLSTTASDCFFRFAVGGTATTGSDYNYQLLEVVGTTVSASRTQNSANHVITSNSSGATIFMTFTVDLFSPQVATQSGLQVQHQRTDTNYQNVSVFSIYGNNAQATSFDGFRLAPSSGTITGDVFVYGLR
jgi:hypothetical protein